MRPAASLAALAFACAAEPAAAQGGPIPVVVIVEPLRWEGTAIVYPPGRTLKIGVRTSIGHLRDVVSESWPLELGEAKGMRRMHLTDAGGTVERDGKSEPMPEAMWLEERDQFDIYRFLQLAAVRAPEIAKLEVNTFQVAGAPLTWFRIDRDGNIVGATNEVPANGETAYQQFRFDGFWKSSESVFPKHMEMLCDGQPYFTLDVTKFEAGGAH